MWDAGQEHELDCVLVGSGLAGSASHPAPLPLAVIVACAVGGTLDTVVRFWRQPCSLAAWRVEARLCVHMCACCAVYDDACPPFPHHCALQVRVATTGKSAQDPDRCAGGWRKALLLGRQCFGRQLYAPIPHTPADLPALHQHIAGHLAGRRAASKPATS